ncbi:MAG TPA: hypothetical protein VMW43_02930 [Bacteroidota bacterium]|nr:hypothetical protein [Bacteroidota bacterium]
MHTMHPQEMELKEKLLSELRRCPECRMEITDPFVERCPRCYAKVPRGSVDCSGCFHKSICPIKPPNR